MKDVLSLAAFAGKVACLVVFVNVLNPDVIRTAEAPGGRSLLKEQRCQSTAPDAGTSP